MTQCAEIGALAAVSFAAVMNGRLKISIEFRFWSD